MSLAIPIDEHRLDNGLHVVLHVDHGMPLVAVNLWYHVGSKNERPGRTGFAHLLEHLLFEGSEHIPGNAHFAYVQQAGGVANGSTWYDRTNYYQTLPAHQLDLGLWLESDRMGFFLSTISQAKLDTQRDVVINERRQRTDNQPYGLAGERLRERLYPEGHPYRWPVIGYVEDLHQATLDDVRSFFSTYYRPNNAVLVLAGDFDPARTIDRVADYFGEIPAGPEPPRLEVPPAVIEGEVREVLEDRVRLPRIYYGWHGPAYGTDDWYAADLLTSVLADGRSSPLHRDLVTERQLARDVGCFVYPTELTSQVLLYATAAPGVAIEELEQALDEHLVRASSELPEDEDLERAKNRLLTGHYNDLQSLDRRADLLARWATFFDDPGGAEREAERYEDLDGEAVRRAGGLLRLDARAAVQVVPRSENGGES